MNCSTISIARAASSAVVTGNGAGNSCAGAAATLNGSNYLTKVSPTKTPTTTMAPILNGNSNTTTTTTTTTTTNNGTCLNGNGHILNNKTFSNQLIMPNVNVNIVANASTDATTATTTTAALQNKKPELAAKIIQQSNVVCFDVDSTVIKEEGIDELANFCGKGQEVARVTKEAMGGGMTFQDALKIRLNIIRPTQQQIADFIKAHPSTLTRNVKTFIEQLRANGKQVYLISGGFDCLIEPVAKELGIPMTHVFANKLLFHYNGDYASFDTTQPTSKSGGKAEAISIIKQRQEKIMTSNNKTMDADTESALITMIGDGATDLEAVPPANHFIGFGGNVLRGEVFKRSQYYVTDFEQLMQ